MVWLWKQGIEMLCAIISVTQMILVAKPSSSTTVGKLIYYR